MLFMARQAVFGAPRKRKRQTGTGATYRDPNFYLSYEQEGADTERGFVHTSLPRLRSTC
jgi:ATP-dependent RNA helicase DDX54/DBP10